MDYHWWRLDVASGTWSHRPGETEITNNGVLDLPQMLYIYTGILMMSTGKSKMPIQHFEEYDTEEIHNGRKYFEDKQNKLERLLVKKLISKQKLPKGALETIPAYLTK